MATPTSETPWTFSNFTGVQNVDALLGGTQWVSKALTFSFPTAFTSTNWSTSSGGGYGPTSGSGEPWSADARALADSDIVAVRAALQSWQAVSGLSFTETADNGTTVGDLRFAYTWGADMDGAQAYAYFPGSGPIGGDVWFNTRGSSFTNRWDAGTFEYLTVVHEIGHALGLKHPFDTSSQSSTLLDPSLDSRSFTVMSYSADPGNADSAFSYEPTTPMVLDIQALQTLYGKNTSTNAGNTNYVYQSGVDYHQTIWDAGGTDTITYQSSTGGEIDLNAGVTGGSRLGNTLYVYTSTSQYVQYNIWIAYGSVIENAVGGSGNDTLIGNVSANSLYGGLGNDSITGGGGNDTLNGSTGNDTMQGGAGSDIFYVNSTGDRVGDTGTAASDVDTVVSGVSWTLAASLERLTLSGGAAIDGTGNAVANLLTGNAAANRLTGGAGNDILNGGVGNDTLDGGAGSDRYDVDAVGDVLSDSGTAAGDRDTVLSSITWTLGNTLENLTLSGSGANRAAGNSLGNLLTGNAAANLLSGGAGNDTLVGGAGNDILYGGAGIDRITAGTGIDVVVLDNRSHSDTVLDFVSGTDDLRLRMGTLAIGDGDLLVEGAVTRTAAGGFSSSAELVIFSTNVASLSTSTAAAAIGSASSAYAIGRTALFVVDTGASSGVYLFTAADANSAVSASELTLLATLSGTASTVVGDYVFSS